MFDEIVIGRVLPGLILESPVASGRLTACSGCDRKYTLPEAHDLRPILLLQLCCDGVWRFALALSGLGAHAHGAGERIIKLLGRLLAGSHQALIIFGYAGCR